MVRTLKRSRGLKATELTPGSLELVGNGPPSSRRALFLACFCLGVSNVGRVLYLPFWERWNLSSYRKQPGKQRKDYYLWYLHPWRHWLSRDCISHQSAVNAATVLSVQGWLTDRPAWDWVLMMISILRCIMQHFIFSK